ncbi:Rieske (2Fe-2S) protein [Thioalkalivibrio sp.]|uniref:Rieske (2Fe-2S) protein n=1 Tax=Thioalkalivibrio sp. TaxID=2093813 RepID=UPI0039767297
MTEWIDVARAGTIEDGDHRLVETADTEVAVFNLGGEYFAVENLCTHEDVPIADGEIDADDCITCPMHEAQFCLRTGEVLEPPAEDPLTRFPVRVEGGMVQVGAQPLDD